MEKSFEYGFSPQDIFTIADAEIKERGLVHHHIDSMNDLYDNGIPQIITQIFSVDKVVENDRNITSEDKEIQTIIAEAKFSNIVMHRPTTINYQSGKEVPLFPKTAILQDKTYSAALYADVTIKATAYHKNGMQRERKSVVERLKLCKVPVMVRSAMCHTYGLTRESLIALEEDPSDPGGYFIIKGIEWVIDCAENILFNQMRIFEKSGYMKEMYRCEFISRPGDTYQNSSEVIIRWLKTDCITVEINRDKLANIQIPFYLIFRILGWSNDQDIFENIALEFESDEGKHMFNFIRNAYATTYDFADNAKYIYESSSVLRSIAEEMKDDDLGFKYLKLDDHPENYQFALKTLQNMIDNNFLPHVGKRPEDRHRKALYLALMIRSVFKVSLGTMKETDRDSYISKRVFPAGVCFAKALKTYFRASVVQQIKKRLNNDFRSMSFSQVDLPTCIRSSIYGGDFERLMIQSITSGTKTQLSLTRRKPIINRLMSQLLSRKNQLSVISSLRQVVASGSDSSKQSERANDMRRVHNSFLGYICLVHSPEGEAAGINKQIACTATICKAHSSEFLKKKLRDDPLLIGLEDLTAARLAEVHNIYVNGDWIGAVDDSLRFVNKYKDYRRMQVINPMTSICWDNMQDEIFFWTDVGRMARPLIIVYNTKRDREFLKASRDGEFKQGTILTKQHLEGLYSGTFGIADLLKARVVEYITADELPNCYIASSFDELKLNADNELYEYTHCEIPEAQFGITALITPYGHHNQTVRTTYETAQARQACGYFALNWPVRCDKETFLQYINETPLTSTIVNKYIYPNGNNIIVAVMINSGFGQEDSIIINKAAFERGLFNGCSFKYEKAELEQKEEFGIPDISTTRDIKPANYEKLDENGLIKIGTIVNKGDVIIGKYVRLAHVENEKYTMADKSIVYREEEPAIVHNVILGKNEEAERFCKVLFRKPRNTIIGDKFCILPKAEILTHLGWVRLKDIDITVHKVATLVNGTDLSYVHPSNKYEFDYDGLMCEFDGENAYQLCTPNHKIYIKQDNDDDDTFGFAKAKTVFNTTITFKNDANNIQNETRYYWAKDSNGNGKTYPMTEWLILVGMFLMDGIICQDHHEENLIRIATKHHVKKIVHRLVCDVLEIKFLTTATETVISGSKYPHICNELQALYRKTAYKRIPEYVWQLSQENCKILLEAMIERIDDSVFDTLHTPSEQFADDVTRLALHAGYASRITEYADHLYSVQIFAPDDSDCTVLRGQHEMIPYAGKVGCIEVPDTHLFYYRENKFSPPIWTGNSSRAGQKGIVALKMRGSDMPFDENGMTPALIFNPHKQSVRVA